MVLSKMGLRGLPCEFRGGKLVEGLGLGLATYQV